MHSSGMDDCARDWEELQDNYQQLQDTHRLYKHKLEEVTKLQSSCATSIVRQKRKLKALAESLKKCKDSKTDDQNEIKEIEARIKERQSTFFEMEAFLPKENGLYLRLVLGNVNVTLLSKQAKFAYKDEYEKFKLYLTSILMVLSFMCRFALNSRVLDAVFNFLLVWYYCTLTIRESILINNGSRIKGWWVLNHYVSTFLSGVMLTWPDGLMYQIFRYQYLSFSMYQSFVQFLQYYYQSGCLYRLRALGERHNMDLTVAPVLLVSAMEVLVSDRCIGGKAQYPLLSLLPAEIFVHPVRTGAFLLKCSTVIRMAWRLSQCGKAMPREQSSTCPYGSKALRGDQN